jgi:hypothetical protein
VLILPIMAWMLATPGAVTLQRMNRSAAADPEVKV